MLPQSLKDELRQIEERVQPLLEEEKRKQQLAQRAPVWKRVIWTAFTILFFAVWINGVLAAYFFISTYNRHTNQIRPDAAHTEALTSHGRTVYITPAEDRRVKFFMRGFMYGIPGTIVVALLLDLSGIGAFGPPGRLKKKANRLTRLDEEEAPQTGHSRG